MRLLLASAPRTAEKRALLLSFAAFGSFWGSLAALLPDVRVQVEVDDGRLALDVGDELHPVVPHSTAMGSTNPPV